MKKHLLWIAFMVWGGMLFAQTTIHISDPEHWTTSQMAQYVGQVVTFDCPMVVSNNYSGLIIGPRRIFAPTNQVVPNSPEYANLLTLNNNGTMSLSGVSGSHRTGEKIVNLTAKVTSPTSLSYQSGQFVGNTRQDLMNGPDLSVIDPKGERNLLVCTMNLEYYLAYDFDPSSTMGPDNASEHAKQRTKTIAALSTINADVYGLVEIQQGDSALKEIARYLNMEHPERTYKYVASGTIASGTFTQSAYIYDSRVVETVGSRQDINTGVKNRKRMQVFREKESGETFIFSVNHFKAKSGSGGGKDADLGDGQGGFNYSRTQEAQAVLDRYSTYRLQVEDDDILIMGDLNAYAKEDPITTLIHGGMTDLHRHFHADSSYSYTFRGQAGYLDHALCSRSMLPQVTGMAAYHINSDEDDRNTYDGGYGDLTMFRCSDHDPVLVGLHLAKVKASTDQANVRWSIESDDESIIITNAKYSDTPAYYAIYTPEGFMVEHAEIQANDYSVQKPLTAGLYILVVYANGTAQQTKFIVK